MTVLYRWVVLVLTIVAGGNRYSEMRRAARCIRDIYYRGCPGKTVGAIYVGPGQKTRIGIRLYTPQQWRRAWALAVLRIPLDSPGAFVGGVALSIYILLSEVGYV